MGERITYFDKENTDRISDYLLRMEEYLTQKNNGSCLVLGAIYFLNTSGSFDTKSNILGPIYFKYFIQLSVTTHDDFRKIEDTNLKNFVDDLTFLHNELSVLSNRIEDYYENVKVSFNFNTSQKICFDISIELTDKEKLELVEWIEKYSPKVTTTHNGINWLTDDGNPFNYDDIMTSIVRDTLFNS